MLRSTTTFLQKILGAEVSSLSETCLCYHASDQDTIEHTECTV